MTVYGSNLEKHKVSMCMGLAMCGQVEGIARQAILKNGEYNNVVYTSLLRDEYLYHKQQGDYEYKKIIARLLKAKKELKKMEK